jgi:hypothetical protein
MAVERDDHSFGDEEGRRRSIVVFGLVGVALLAAVWFLFLRGGADGPGRLVATTTDVTESIGEQAAEPVAHKQGSHVETFEIFAPKDPFDPLISTAPVSSGPALASGEIPATGSATTQEPGISESAGTTTITTESTTPAQSSANDGHRVKVIDVFSEDGDDRAQIQINGTMYTIDEGERFAGSFELVSASKACATMLFGDDEFTLCEGEEILK